MKPVNTNKALPNLVFGRRVGEVTVIGTGANAVRVTVVEIQGSQVKLSFSGPRDVAIDREEIRQRKEMAAAC